MRYFSFTRYDVHDLLTTPVPGLALGSVMDGDLVAPENGPNAGWFILAFTRAADRPSNATTANGITWVDWGPLSAQAITVRTMSIVPEWADGRTSVDGINFPYVGADWATPVSTNGLCSSTTAAWQNSETTFTKSTI